MRIAFSALSATVAIASCLVTRSYAGGCPPEQNVTVVLRLIRTWERRLRHALDVYINANEASRGVSSESLYDPVYMGVQHGKNHGHCSARPTLSNVQCRVLPALMLHLFGEPDPRVTELAWTPKYLPRSVLLSCNRGPMAQVHVAVDDGRGRMAEYLLITEEVDRLVAFVGAVLGSQDEVQISQDEVQISLDEVQISQDEVQISQGSGGTGRSVNVTSLALLTFPAKLYVWGRMVEVGQSQIVEFADRTRSAARNWKWVARRSRCTIQDARLMFITHSAEGDTLARLARELGYRIAVNTTVDRQVSRTALELDVCLVTKIIVSSREWGQNFFGFLKIGWTQVTTALDAGRSTASILACGLLPPSVPNTVPANEIVYGPPVAGRDQQQLDPKLPWASYGFGCYNVSFTKK